MFNNCVIDCIFPSKFPYNENLLRSMTHHLIDMIITLYAAAWSFVWDGMLEAKSMGGTNPNTLSGATITVSWEPAKWSHTPLVVSHTFRIRAGSYISLALQDSPYGSFLRSSRFSSVFCSTRRPCGVHRAYPGHKPHNGTDGLTPRGEPRPTTPRSLC